MAEGQTEHKKKRDRSPSYPGIGLQEAIDKANALYREESRHSAPVEVILQHWGYTPKSSSGLVALAALKKFGLLVDEGTGTGRQARISEDAFKILVDDRPNSPERLRLIQKAALAPPIHKELWDQYSGKLPSDATLRVQLRNRGFTENAANDFIGVLHKTIAFAKLSESDTISPSFGDKDGDMGAPESKGADLFSSFFKNPFEEPKKSMEQAALTHEEHQKQQEPQVIRIPLPNNNWVAMQLPVPMSENSWDQMITVLNAMKPGLVTPAQQRKAVHKSRLSQEAQELLRKVEAGGIPMYMNDNLQRIAKEHGIEVSGQTTPNQVIEQLKGISE